MPTSNITAVQTGSGWDVDGPTVANVQVDTSTNTLTSPSAQEAVMGASNGPFGDFTMAPKTMGYKLEKLAYTQGQTVTLMNTGSVGPGCLRSFVFIGGTTKALCRDGYFKIYVDGAATPISIQGHVFGTFYQPLGGRVFTQHLLADTYDNTESHIACHFPIPFRQSLRIDYTSANGSGDLFFNAAVEVGVTHLWEFGYSGLGYDTRLVGLTPAQQGNRSVKFLQRPAGERGVIAGFTMCASGGTYKNYYENNIVVYDATQALDGSADPFYNTSGTEDFFYEAYGWNGDNDVFNGPHGFISSHGTSNQSGSATLFQICAHMDLLSAMGGIAYNNGAVMCWETGNAADPGTPSTNTDLFYGVWYYKRLSA